MRSSPWVTLFGFVIISGVTVREMATEEDLSDSDADLISMGPDDYLLLSTEPDRDAAHRWNVAHTIRNKDASVRDKELEYFRENVGRQILNEELRYVAGDDVTEWARRVRELRTEYGWPILTKSTGRPDLSVSVYVLEADRQSPEHDRRIPDPVRRAVLRRDEYTCQHCDWAHDLWNRSDPRHLELHHMEHHVDGGENVEDNLIVVCTVCHDVIHAED